MLDLMIYTRYNIVLEIIDAAEYCLFLFFIHLKLHFMWFETGLKMHFYGVLQDKG